jgi:hypothetical protein
VTYALDLSEKQFQLKYDHNGDWRKASERNDQRGIAPTFVWFWWVHAIHSEYRMTELLSQAYSLDKVYLSAFMDAHTSARYRGLTYIPHGKTGGINVIDSQLNSCSFIATQDLGKITNNSFEILRRFDNSDIRGCNLMVL